MRRSWFIAMLCGLLTACPESAPAPYRPVAYTGLQGSVHLPHGVEEAEVCAYALTDAGVAAEPEGCGVTDAQGYWTINGGSLTDNVYLEAKAAAYDFRLSAVATQIRRYAQAAPIPIHPISHLTAGYALHLLGQGAGAQPSVDLARIALNLHFGAVAHHHIQAWAALNPTSEQTPVPLSSSVKAYLFTAGMDMLARRISADSGLAEDTAVTGHTLITALYDDIAADGVFDGIGMHGVQLMQHQTLLGPNTLRLDLAIAIAQLMRSPMNATGLTASDVTPILEALAASQGRIFPDPGRSYRASVPELSSCTVWREDKQASSLDHPQRGLIEVHCAWSDAIGLEGTSMQVQSEGGEAALRLFDEPHVALAAVIDTRELADDTPHKLVVQATNKAGATSTVDLTLMVDNTPLSLLQIDRRSHWTGAAEPFRVSGDVDKPLRRVVLTPGEFAPVVKEYPFEDQVHHFEVSYPQGLPCNREYGLRIELQDWTGDSVTRTLIATCDDVPPVLSLVPQTFVQELSQKTVDLWDWTAENPPTFEKYYHRLDYLPESQRGPEVQNLPVLAFRVHDKDTRHPGATSADLHVEYSYAMNQNLAHQREWQALFPHADGIYRLPVSYQTLLPLAAQSPADNFIARCHATDLHQIAVRVTDPAGNQSTSVFPFYLHLAAPPISVSGCGPTGALLGASLVHPNFDSVFSRHFDLFDAHVDYRVDLPDLSLAPQSGVVIQVARDPIQTAFTHIKRSRGLVSKARRGREMVVDTHRHNASVRISRIRDAVREPPCNKGQRLMLENGTCHTLTKALQYPHTKVDEKSWPSRQAVDVVAYTPSGYPAHMDEGTVELPANSPYLLRTRMQGDFTLENGNAVQWQRVPDADGTLVVELDHQYGVEASDKVETLFEVRHSIAGLKMMDTPLRVSIVYAMAGLPPPIGVEADASCSTSGLLTWSASP